MGKSDGHARARAGKVARCRDIPRGMPSADGRKTSVGIDAAQARGARDTGSGDGAEEAVKRGQRQALLDLLSTPAVLELEDPVVMAGAWRRHPDERRDGCDTLDA